jgi:hypothetical protein
VSRAWIKPTDETSEERSTDVSEGKGDADDDEEHDTREEPNIDTLQGEGDADDDEVDDTSEETNKVASQGEDDADDDEEDVSTGAVSRENEGEANGQNGEEDRLKARMGLHQYAREEKNDEVLDRGTDARYPIIEPILYHPLVLGSHNTGLK